MAIEHPHPTTSTVKQLYAHAFRCAYPGCHQPLYSEDTLSGAWVLNSRICHINARSEGGPRWDPRQSAEDNRAESNLVLMCLEHASIIDGPKALDTYPAERLLAWKRDQIAEFQQLRQGWPLTNSMAEAAIGVSFTDVAVAIHSSKLQLGGGGGNAPGAGGGGGGAIGPHARAGAGGPGGRRLDFEGNPLPEDWETDLPELADIHPPPGSGGGGGGSVGPGAIGGDGGGGGDFVRDGLPLEAGDVLEIEVGAAGDPPRLPGQHPPHGGDSIIRIRSAEGVLKRVIRAEGGQGARAGRLPDDWATISDEDLRSGFSISALFPVNAAEFREGLLFAIGAGWVRYEVNTLPSETVWGIVCIANWENLSPRGTRGLQLCLTDPVGTEVSRIALAITPEDASGTTLMWRVGLGAPLDRVGRWSISVQSGDFLLSRIGVQVNLVD